MPDHNGSSITNLKFGWGLLYISEELSDQSNQEQEDIYEQVVWEYLGIPHQKWIKFEDNPAVTDCSQN